MTTLSGICNSAWNEIKMLFRSASNLGAPGLMGIIMFGQNQELKFLKSKMITLLRPFRIRHKTKTRDRFLFAWKGIQYKRFN